jgi:uncharacterized protein
MTVVVIIVLILALLGHWSLCVGLFNRAAASRLPCWLVGLLEKFAVLMAAVGPILFGVWLWMWPVANLGEWFARTDGRLWLLYQTFCVVAGVKLLASWRPEWSRPPLLQLVSNDTEYVDVARELGYWPIGNGSTRWAAAIPGNEICRLALPVKTLRLTSLPPQLDGLSMVHLSDLHLTGQLTRDYYRYAIDRANQLGGDLAVVTGDILDHAACLDWIPETLGRLEAKHGVYFILGNHDHRAGDVAGLRKRLTGCGLIDVGGRTLTLTINDAELHLAGNELPWFPLRAAPERFQPEALQAQAFRVLLAHTPDQYVWARDHHYHLMLAGHCHGGQVRLPLLGPVVSPSRYGARYASGLFYETPTLLHVSRGLSGTHPLRWNCQPEIAKLVLRYAETQV